MNIKTFTLVMVEDENGKKTFSFDGNINLQEAIAYCQDILIKIAQKQAVEKFKKGNENGDILQ
jgi:hypothetical protein